MTDKVTVQLPAPFTGKVLRLLAKEGEVVLVGNPIIVIGEPEEAAPPTSPPTPTHKETVPGRGSAGPPPGGRPARWGGGPGGAGPRGGVRGGDTRAPRPPPAVSIPSVAAKPAPA